MEVGGMFGLASNIDDEVVVWGIFNKQTLTIPKTIGRITAVSTISCGWEHAVLLDSIGVMFGVGCNKFNQLSASKTETYYTEPLKIAGNAQLVACGFRQTYYTSKSILYGRGQNRYFELTDEGADAEGWTLMMKHGQPFVKLGCGKCFFVVLD